MTEKEEFDLYESLKLSNVSVHKENHKFSHVRHYYTDTVYSFDSYKIIETLHTQNSRLPNLYFICIFQYNRPLGMWCKKQPEKAKNIFEIYQAAKNKIEKKHLKQYQ